MGVSVASEPCIDGDEMTQAEELEEVKRMLWDMYYSPYGSLWNFGTTPTRIDKARAEGVREVALQTLSIIDRENVKRIMK